VKVLNVGGGSNRTLPKEYAGWEQDLLDVDASLRPDILCDARHMSALPAEQYDAVFCSHTLEHFYQHEIPQVLEGFLHVLKLEGFAHIIVPDMEALFQALVKDGRDVHDIWYVSPAGPITFYDVLYGWGRQVEIGNFYYCHKTGFTPKALFAALTKTGFRQCAIAKDGFNLFGYGFKSRPHEDQLVRLGLKHAHLP